MAAPLHDVRIGGVDSDEALHGQPADARIAKEFLFGPQGVVSRKRLELIDRRLSRGPYVALDARECLEPLREPEPVGVRVGSCGELDER